MDILRPYIENMLLRLRNQEEMENMGRLGDAEDTPFQANCKLSLDARFLTRCDTKRAVQPQKMARGLKFRI